MLVRYLRERGWKRLGVLTSSDASGQGWDRALRAVMERPENSDVQIVGYEHMSPSDITVSAQWTRIKAAGPQAVLVMPTGPAWGTAMRNLVDVGLDVPVAASNGNLNRTQLEQYRNFLPPDLFFPGPVSLVPNSVGHGPIEEAQRAYFGALKEAGLQSDLGYSIGWDPAWLLIGAVRSIGLSATAAQLRTYINTLHGWVGISGVYDFRDGMQRGVGENSLVVDRWDAKRSTFEPVSHAGGYAARK